MALYSKPYSSPTQLATILQSRGLTIENIDMAESYLRRIGYYRFSAYLYPLLASPKEKHLFKPGSSFDKAMDIYRFDHRLRILLFDEIEKIEIAVRSAVINITAYETGNPFWMTDQNYFKSTDIFNKTIKLIESELTKSREDFIHHFNTTYSNKYPPAWMIGEVLPLGTLTRIYGNIKSNQIRKKIAREFSLEVPVFNSWMTIITVARNNCCHHARVWNRTFALKALLMKNMSQPWIEIPVNQQKIYFSFCIIKYFLNIISPTHDLTGKIEQLFAEFPNIDITAMGFPSEWKNEALWQTPVRKED